MPVRLVAVVAVIRRTAIFSSSLVSSVRLSPVLFFMLLTSIKKVIFWSYGRTTWQYDVLCVAILAFVFLTPKGWFEWGELACAPAHQNLHSERHKSCLSGRRKSAATAQPDAHEHRALRAQDHRASPTCASGAGKELRTTDGRTVAFEVDIE